MANFELEVRFPNVDFIRTDIVIKASKRAFICLRDSVL